MDTGLPGELFGNGVVAAPMAGGPSRAQLALAASGAGGLGFLAGGYKSPDAFSAEVLSVLGTGLPFGVNLFVPGGKPADRAAVLAYRERLRPVAERLGAGLPEPRWTDDDAYPAKLDFLLAHTPHVVSFTFALPPAEDVARLRAAGAFVVQTVTGPHEARAAAELGVDGLVVQHPDAGGHSGAFLPEPAGAGWTLGELVTVVRHAVGLPLIAAGGIGTPADADAARAAGAAAIQLGTAFLRTPEAGTNATHRAALADSVFDRTAQTRAFSGKIARGPRERVHARVRRRAGGLPDGALPHGAAPRGGRQGWGSARDQSLGWDGLAGRARGAGGRRRRPLRGVTTGPGRGDQSSGGR